MTRAGRGRSPWRPLIVTIAAVVIMAAMLTVVVVVTGSAGRSAGRASLEPQSAAEERCAGLVPAGTADSREYQECVAGEMDRSPQSRLGSIVFPALLAVLLGSVALVLVGALL